jgi:hypothetical protein
VDAASSIVDLFDEAADRNNLMDFMAWFSIVMIFKKLCGLIVADRWMLGVPTHGTIQFGHSL